VTGLSVWAAARVMSTAGPSEIVVSDSMRALLSDAGIPLEDRGAYPLKGLPGEWRLHARPGPAGATGEE
jgi:class 3 adenylate cyclase